jgi:hypothetical protein
MRDSVQKSFEKIIDSMAGIPNESRGYLTVAKRPPD